MPIMGGDLVGYEKKEEFGVPTREMTRFRMSRRDLSTRTTKMFTRVQGDVAREKMSSERRQVALTGQTAACIWCSWMIIFTLVH